MDSNVHGMPARVGSVAIEDPNFARAGERLRQVSFEQLHNRGRAKKETPDGSGPSGYSQTVLVLGVLVKRTGTTVPSAS